MNSDELRDLTESYYQGVYSEDNIYEAKADENLSPLEKIRKRNKEYAIAGEPAGQQTSNRRAEHKSIRGDKKERGTKSAFGTMKHVGGPYKESQDLYDVVLDHLLSEGYADDARSAAVIMPHMSNEWLSDILGESKSDDQCDQKLKDMGVPESWRNGVKRTARRARNHPDYQPKPTERQKKLKDKLSQYKG
jgi:hypothetical protein